MGYGALGQSVGDAAMLSNWTGSNPMIDSMAGLGSVMPKMAGAGAGMMGTLGGIMGSPITAGIGGGLNAYMAYKQGKANKEAQKQQMKESRKGRIANQGQNNIMALLAIAKYADSLLPGYGGR